MSKSAKSYFKGNNFMTPDILETGFKGKYAYELSTGPDFCREPIFGVTLANRSTGEQLHDQSRCFQGPSALSAARSYIENLSSIERDELTTATGTAQA